MYVNTLIKYFWLLVVYFLLYIDLNFMKLSSHNEWDPLKEVIVGVASLKLF